MQTGHDLCAPDFWGANIWTEYIAMRMHAKFHNFPKQQIQAALNAVKDGEAMRYAANVHDVSYSTLS